MDETKAIATVLQNAIGSVPSGAIRFWGDWFGILYDNVHTLSGCEVSDGALRLRFDQGEMLTIWSPCELTLGAKTLRIAAARRVRWEWFKYGCPTPESLCFKEFTKSGEALVVSTNNGCYTLTFHPTVTHPAVEIVTL